MSFNVILLTLMRHMTQLRAAVEKTTGLSVDRKASNTSMIATKWELSITKKWVTGKSPPICRSYYGSGCKT